MEALYEVTPIGAHEIAAEIQTRALSSAQRPQGRILLQGPRRDRRPSQPN